MSLSTYLTRMGAAHKGALCMMQDRGYQLQSSDERLLIMPALEVALAALEAARTTNISLGQAMSRQFPKAQGKPSVALVFVDRNFDDAKGREIMVSSAQVRQCMEDARAAQLIVVVPHKLSPDAKKTAAAAAPALQVLLGESLFIPLGRHAHVPRHVALSEQDAQALEAARGIQRWHLPVLLLSDPASQYYGFREGDVVRIDRPAGAFFRTVCA